MTNLAVTNIVHSLHYFEREFWLQQQRLDIYFKGYNIGIEYDGQLHFKPIETFGGNKRFEQQKTIR